MCHQRHNGQGLTGRLDIGCGSPAALPRGPRRKVQSAECAKELAAGEQEATPSLPASVYDKGLVAPTPFSQEGGGLPIHCPLLEIRVPRRQPPKHLPDNAVCIAGTAHAREEWDDWCVVRRLTTRAPNPPSRLISPSRPISQAVPAHRSEDVPTCQTRCQSRGVGFHEKKTVIDRPKSYIMI